MDAGARPSVFCAAVLAEWVGGWMGVPQTFRVPVIASDVVVLSEAKSASARGGRCVHCCPSMLSEPTFDAA